jgi:cysteine desulfurase
LFTWFFSKLKHNGRHILVTGIEHASILRTCEHLKQNCGAKITYIPVYNDGIINYNKLIKLIRPDTIMCIVMSENNEIGTRQPPLLLKKIGLLCKKHNIHFHCDATQTIGHRKFYPKKYYINSMTCSAHKFHGPRGIGCMFIDKNTSYDACCFTGGQQELGKRAGTENLAGIIGMVSALKYNLSNTKLKKTQQYIKKLRIYMKNELIKNIPNIIINGPKSQKYCKFNTLSICLPNINSRKLLPYLDKYHICINIGSACSQGKRSHVLKACGIPEELELGLLRISLSEYNTLKEIKYVINILTKLYYKYNGILI